MSRCPRSVLLLLTLFAVGGCQAGEDGASDDPAASRGEGDAGATTNPDSPRPARNPRPSTADDDEVASDDDVATDDDDGADDDVEPSPGTTPGNPGGGPNPDPEGSGAEPEPGAPNPDAPAGDDDNPQPSVPGSPDDGGSSTPAEPLPNVPLNDVVDPDRVTEWNPGILSDDLLGLPLGSNGLPVRDTLCATLSPGDDIQQAIDDCSPGEVVELAAGTFELGDTVTLRDGVVLRGQGSEGAPTGTTLVKQGGETVLAIGTTRDQICYGGDGIPLLEDAAKESTTVVLGDAASEFSAGDLALIDIVDPSEVQQGDCLYFKREEGRSLSQRVEIAGVDAASGTLTLSSPLHWNFRSSDQAEITKTSDRPTRWAGIEHLRLQGGTNPGYNGQMAGGIDISNAAYSWVLDVQTDETIGGMHVSLTATYRTVVRDGYFHHSANYGFGADCYGIVLRCGTSESLVENNIVRYMNKPILFNVTGGGNVIGYNYADNSWATPPEWQEVNIDCHCSFPHMELMEGNFAPHMGATATHGNAGYLTYLRNYSSSQFAPPAVAGSNEEQTGNLTALQFDAGDVGMNVIGNVLGTEGKSTTYEAYDSGPVSIYELGQGGDGRDDVAATSLYRHGNFDFVNGDTLWADGNESRELPASFYYSSKPAWWPADMPFPWVGPDLDPMVGVLPAKARSLALE